MPVHLYGVLRGDAGPPHGGSTSSRSALDGPGRRGHPLRLVGGQDLRALVSDIEDDSTVGRDDLLAHAHVLEQVAAETAVIPVQFGTIAPDDEAVVHDVLEPQHDELTALLDTFADVVQLTVDVSHREEPALREVLLRDDALVQMREHVRARPADQGAKMRLGEAVSAALEALRADDAALVTDRVAPHARAIAENEPRGARAVTSLALLVDRADHAALDEAVTLLSDELGPRARVRYVGPQPPYSFLDPVIAGELTWA